MHPIRSSPSARAVAPWADQLQPAAPLARIEQAASSSIRGSSLFPTVYSRRIKLAAFEVRNEMARYPTLTILVAAVGLGACASIPKAPAPALSGPAVPHDVTAGQARLAARVYPRLAAVSAPNDNLFVSPLSLAEGLGLAALGARVQTETELRGLLGWDGHNRPELLIAAYDRLLTQTGDPKIGLSVANALWLSKSMAFEESYLVAAKTSLEATASTLDFVGDPKGSAKRINGWVAQETRDRITKIVEPDALNTSTAAVLTNAVWFKADWSVPFADGATRPFTRGDGSKRDVYMMERIAPMAYRETREGQAVALPYGAGRRFVMEVFLTQRQRDAATLGTRPFAAFIPGIGPGQRWQIRPAHGSPARDSAASSPLRDAFRKQRQVSVDRRGYPLRIQRHLRRLQQNGQGTAGDRRCRPRNFPAGRRKGHRGGGGYCYHNRHDQYANRARRASHDR